MWIPGSPSPLPPAAPPCRGQCLDVPWMSPSFPDVPECPGMPADVPGCQKWLWMGGRPFTSHAGAATAKLVAQFDLWAKFQRRKRSIIFQHDIEPCVTLTWKLRIKRLFEINWFHICFEKGLKPCVVAGTGWSSTITNSSPRHTDELKYRGYTLSAYYLKRTPDPKLSPLFMFVRQVARCNLRIGH